MPGAAGSLCMGSWVLGGCNTWKRKTRSENKLAGFGPQRTGTTACFQGFTDTQQSQGAVDAHRLVVDAKAVSEKRVAMCCPEQPRRATTRHAAPMPHELLSDH
ncbi:hypothetical protein CC86DRAFT_379921 [Ophiobolus disseminans]|uniref:Uncharacterized protein n=1 Tax=Ophiobolus disseminans TaxID=1469910 RepID=A0A6A7A7M9_9PLEO|nr:hypothetical protein CC86DRAFT_379921 [Ophiobolus disseminans]